MSSNVSLQAPKPVAKAAKAAPAKVVAKKAPVESSSEEESSSDEEVWKNRLAFSLFLTVSTELLVIYGNGSILKVALIHHFSCWQWCFFQDAKPAAKPATKAAAKVAAKSVPAKKAAAPESSSEEESSDEDEEMPPAKVAPVKNGKPAAKAPVESSSEEDSDDESEEEVKVLFNAVCSLSRRSISKNPCDHRRGLIMNYGFYIATMSTEIDIETVYAACC